MTIKLKKLIYTDQILSEGLIKSVNIQVLKDNLDRWLLSHIEKSKSQISKNNKKLLLHFFNKISTEDVNLLEKYINNLGWFISAYLNKKTLPLKWIVYKKEDFLEKINNDFTYFSLQLEAKFDIHVPKENLESLYHITKSTNIPKILKIGLIPKTASKISTHPERIYFAYDISGVELLRKKFQTAHINEKYTTLRLDIKKMVMDRNIDIIFREDPNFVGGCYTTSNIPPKYLKII